MFASLAVGDSEYVNEGYQNCINEMCYKLVHFKITPKKVETLTLESQFASHPKGDETWVY